MLVRVAAAGDTFGKSSTRCRGWSSDSVRDDGVSRPFPASVTVVVVLVRDACTFSRRVAVAAVVVSALSLRAFSAGRAATVAPTAVSATGAAKAEGAGVFPA